MQPRAEQLALLAEYTPDAVFLLGPDGMCSYASPSARALFHMDAGQLVGRSLLDRLHPDDQPTARAEFDDLVAGKRETTIVSFIAEIGDRSGEYAWMEAHCGLAPLPGADETGVIIASIRNVDRNKALERELRRAREQAEAVAAAKSAFLTNMSHEIRTPMNGVIGFTELALAGDLRPDLRRQIAMIADSGRAMMRLLNGMLDMAKIEAGMMSIAPEPVDLRLLLSDCVRLMDPAARSKGVALGLEVDPAVPPWIEVDPLRVRQIALNLIGNALKFTHQGGVSVETTVRGARLFLSVIDSGIGIPTDQLSRVFGRFTQADDTIARRYGGTGLGLPISQQLAELMGGELSVQSVEGQGSTFLLTLPLVPASSSPAVSNALPRLEIAAGLRSNVRILVAEDHDINQELIRDMADKAGYAIEMAADGADAIAMVLAAAQQGRPYDLVLMDVQMPVIDGLEATRRLRDAGFTPERLPIVAVTANAYAEDAAACVAAGMQDRLAKPLRLRDLTAAISRWKPSVGGVPATPDEDIPPPAALHHRFDARKREAAARIAEVLQSGELGASIIVEIAGHLHKIAGTAAHFGEGHLGEGAAELEKALRQAPPSEARDTLEAALLLLRPQADPPLRQAQA